MLVCKWDQVCEAAHELSSRVISRGRHRSPGVSLPACINHLSCSDASPEPLTGLSANPWAWENAVSKACMLGGCEELRVTKKKWRVRFGLFVCVTLQVGVAELWLSDF